MYLLRLQNTLSRAGIIVSSADGEACSRQFDHRRVMFVGRSAAPTPTKGLADKKRILARFLLFAREERCLFTLRLASHHAKASAWSLSRVLRRVERPLPPTIYIPCVQHTLT